MKKNWRGTISGTLSHYSGVFFQSGILDLKLPGWWKLVDNDPPEILVEKCKSFVNLYVLWKAYHFSVVFKRII